MAFQAIQGTQRRSLIQKTSKDPSHVHFHSPVAVAATSATQYPQDRSHHQSQQESSYGLDRRQS